MDAIGPLYGGLGATGMVGGGPSLPAGPAGIGWVTKGDGWGLYGTGAEVGTGGVTPSVEMRFRKGGGPKIYPSCSGSSVRESCFSMGTPSVSRRMSPPYVVGVASARGRSTEGVVSPFIASNASCGGVVGLRGPDGVDCRGWN